MRSGGGGLLGEGLGTSFVSVNGSKLEVSEGSEGRNLVVLVGGKTSVAVLDQEVVIYNGKYSSEVQGGRAGAATII